MSGLNFKVQWFNVQVIYVGVSTPSDAGLCDTCESPCHKSCLKSSSESQHVMVCTLCYQKELMDRERRGTKRKQEKQASDMLAKSARRYKQAKIGDSVMVHLPELERGRCEFPNVHAVVLEINEAGMYKPRVYCWESTPETSLNHCQNPY